MTALDAETRELINAAYAVATYPSTGAYRNSASDKKIWSPHLRRLMEALDPFVKAAGQEEMRKRIEALAKADAAHEAWREQNAAEAAERARLRAEAEIPS